MDNLKLFGNIEIFLVEMIMYVWFFGSVVNVVVDILSYYSFIWLYYVYYVV